MGIASIVRRITSPLLQVGDLAFDAEVQVTRGGKTQFTRDRIGAGVSLSSHSYNQPREFTITGGVSGISQFHNVGRPGFNPVQGFTDLGLGALEGLTGINFSTRVQDFEQRLQVTQEARDELELISKVLGRVRVVLTSWQAMTGAEDGDSAQYQMTFEEVLRSGLTITDAVDAALAMNGSGGVPPAGSSGASTTTDMMVDVVP